MKVLMLIEDVCVNVIAERDAKNIAFTYPGCATRTNVRAAENKYLGINQWQASTTRKTHGYCT